MCLRQSQLVYPGLNMSCWLVLGLMVVLLQNGASLFVVRVCFHRVVVVQLAIHSGGAHLRHG